MLQNERQRQIDFQSMTLVNANLFDDRFHVVDKRASLIVEVAQVSSCTAT